MEDAEQQQQQQQQQEAQEPPGQYAEAHLQALLQATCYQFKTGEAHAPLFCNPQCGCWVHQ
jgi:hypothetical protein